MNMRMFASFTLFVMLLVWLGMSDAKRSLSKKTHERLHKFFPDDDDYIDSWDSLRGFKQSSLGKPLVPYASELHKARDVPDIVPPTQDTQPANNNRDEAASSLPLPPPKFKPGVEDEWSKSESLDEQVDKEGHAEEMKRKNDRLRFEPKTHSFRGSTHDCSAHYCPVGRVCELDSRGKPFCACAGPDHCLRQHRGARRAEHKVRGRKVCGSDGVVYPSHCEMHRMACVLGRHIHASRDEALCVEKDRPVLHDNLLDTDLHTSGPLVSSPTKSIELPTALPLKADDDYNDNDDADDEVKKAKVRYFRTTVVAASGLEIKCDDVTSEEEGGQALWKRDGVLLSDLVNNDIQVFADGSLYFTNVETYHIGNYSCGRRFLGLSQAPPTQIHLLSVIAPPQVSVSPVTQQHIPGMTVTVRCHTAAIPEASISWRIDNKPLENSEANALVLDGGQVLQIQNLDAGLNGSRVTCVGENSAGSSEATAVLYVRSGENARYQQADTSSEEYYVVFHADGYTVYEPNYCHIMHVVSGDYFLDSVTHNSQTSTLCGEDKTPPGNSTCVWGQAVHVGAKYVYVAQPTLKRVLVIELTDRFNPTEVIEMTCPPKDLTYLEHLDQIWATCGEDEPSDVTRYEPRDTTSHMTSVIRQASLNMRHKTVHIQPLSGITDDFSMVHKMFLPSSHTAGIKLSLTYGYASLGHSEKALYKVDLSQLKLVKYIATSCVPASVAFLPIGGKVIVSCEASSDSEAQSFILDYVTDVIVDGMNGAGSKLMDGVLAGTLYVSPDSRQLTVINGNILSAYYIIDNGELTLLKTFKLEEMKAVTDVQYTISYSSTKHLSSYNLFLRDSEQRILFVDLAYHQISTISGVEQLLMYRQPDANSVSRVISTRGDMLTSAGIFSSHVVSAVDSNIIVIDSQRHVTQCQWPGLTPVSSIVGVRKD